jgi:hypothetical protein
MAREKPHFRSFEEFWPYYVSQHENELCRAFHFVGTALGFACAAATPVFPPALLAAPVVGYGMSWIGHFVFERNRPATFDYWWWSLRGDMRMFRLIATGRPVVAGQSSRQV